MSSRRRFLVVAAALASLATAAGPARAGKNDLSFLNLCKPGSPASLGGTQECSWVQRNAGGTIMSLSPDADAESRYRSLMSELGVVMAPRLMTPADTLGYAGFQFAAELGMTQISRDKDFWNGIQGVSPDNPAAARPDRWLMTAGFFARKGIWLPLPAFEVGAGGVNLVGSSMLSLQTYAKFALHEGFHDWPIPSLAVRGGLARVVGTDQVALTVGSLDASISKRFGLGGTARLEPYGGWSYLIIDARSEVIDATPSCDAYALSVAAATQPFGNPHCAQSQVGSTNDFEANFVFPDQDVITRHRFFGGFKLKFAVLALVTQYEYTLAGRTRDERKANGAKDGSGSQQSFLLSGAFDF